ENVNAVHARAEEAGKNKIYRENYDIACARAVASLPVLLEYCMPFVKRGGSFIAMKGPSIREEYEQSKNALKVLGGGETEIICENLPGNDKRSFIIVKKISQTPPKYPRISAKISKQPL
ncbi:MAG: class I SAM-dependent methyltransferase, partial [Clostridia bacterium]|nr:class I SAM-dependent methyltransferase [Clostridia bacterium]